MTPIQKAVILDYATELQSNDEPWREFEYALDVTMWRQCDNFTNPFTDGMRGSIRFRRKPRTITVTMPPVKSIAPSLSVGICVYYGSPEDRDKALAAIGEAMGDENV